MAIPKLPVVTVAVLAVSLFPDAGRHLWEMLCWSKHALDFKTE